MSLPDPASSIWNPGQGHYFSEEWEGDKARPTLYDNGYFTWPKDFVTTPAGRYRIRRGYLRALTEAGESHATPASGGDATANASPINAAGHGRLHFQFNPSRIQRSVEGRHDIHTWMNTDPAQLTQPIGGMASFGLELIFNREADVAAAPESMKTMDLADITSSSANLARHAGQIGVLADLYVLDAIIGQGVNSMTLQNIITRGRYLSEHQAPSSTDEQTGSLVPAAPFAWDQSAEQEIRDRMEGNSAYLLPQPVRIVMSDLFMIDGLVQSSNVIIQKFSQRMVPTLCSVALGIEAMYFGFRRKDTFMTRMWNKPFEVSKAGAVEGSTGSIATPGAESGVIHRNDPTTDSGTEAIKNKFNDTNRATKGFFHRGQHHLRFKFADFQPDDPKANPPTLRQKFNIDLFADSSSFTELIRSMGFTVWSGVELKLFEYQDHNGTWRTVLANGAGTVEPSVAPTKKENDTRWTTRGAGGEHVITIVPQSGLFRADTGKLHSDRKYRMQLHVYYAVAGSAEKVRSGVYVLWVVGMGSDNISIPTWNYR